MSNISKENDETHLKVNSCPRMKKVTMRAKLRKINHHS